MKLKSFLQKIEEPSFLSSHKTASFVVGEEYPVLFFSMLSHKIKTSGQQMVEHVNLESDEQNQVLSKLETSTFFSDRHYYWLGNISALSAKKKKFWTNYLQQYQGAHTIGFSVPVKDTIKSDNKVVQIDIDATVDQASFEYLARFFSSSGAKKLVPYLFRYGSKISLDKACLLLAYGDVLGGNIRQFCDEWLSVVLNQEQSLFKLSEYLLSKRARSFFTLWSKVGNRYPEVFWLSYWSDILWRAYHYVNATQKGNFTDAKKMSFKLPFAFLKTDWKKVHPIELKQAHHFLYTIDYNLKNGAGSYGLELLYAKFLQGGFKIKESTR